ncbi:hypothetical protein HK101_000266 [Irineochytrium annulatum]|nr:hypothetical protein HK101_000266 [Irineochytrium annulatum]
MRKEAPNADDAGLEAQVDMPSIPHPEQLSEAPLISSPILNPPAIPLFEADFSQYLISRATPTDDAAAEIVIPSVGRLSQSYAARPRSSHSVTRSFRSRRSYGPGSMSATMIIDDCGADLKSLREFHIIQKATLYAKEQTAEIVSSVVRWRGSVIPRIFVPVLIVTAWSIFWTCIYMKTSFNGWGTAPVFSTAITFVVSALLVFKNSSSYDRYYEATRLWYALITQARILLRCIWLLTEAKGDPKVEQTKRSCMNMIVALPVSIMHHVRREPGVCHTDLAHLLVHIPFFHPRNHAALDSSCIPVEITHHLTALILRLRASDNIDLQCQVAMLNALSAILECMTGLERIANTRIPLAYDIHMKSVVVLYLLSLPIQLVATSGYWTIPVMLISSFTFLGIEAIAAELDDPFGKDGNDLPLEVYCDNVRAEVHETIKRDSKRDPMLWTTPIPVAEADRIARAPLRR